MQISQTSTTVQLAEQISAWLRGHLDASGAERFVLALSGGIDSAVVCGLAARAAGPERVLCVIMPSSSNPDDAVSAAAVADAFGVATITIDLTATTHELRSVLPDLRDLPLPSAADPEAMATTLDTDSHRGASAAQLADANLKPRLRMTTVYYVANLCGGIVLGTGNKSEAMIGYFTKYGDGGVDLLPIVDLYKHEVRELARTIGVPESVIQRPPSAGLWEGQTDEDEIGISYDQLDEALDAFERGDTASVDSAVLDKVQRMIDASAHKRQPIPRFSRDRLG